MTKHCRIIKRTALLLLCAVIMLSAIMPVFTPKAHASISIPVTMEAMRQLFDVASLYSGLNAMERLNSRPGFTDGLDNIQFGRRNMYNKELEIIREAVRIMEEENLDVTEYNVARIMAVLANNGITYDSPDYYAEFERLWTAIEMRQEEIGLLHRKHRATKIDTSWWGTILDGIEYIDMLDPVTQVATAVPSIGVSLATSFMNVLRNIFTRTNAETNEIEGIQELPETTGAEPLNIGIPISYPTLPWDAAVAGLLEQRQYNYYVVIRDSTRSRDVIVMDADVFIIEDNRWLMMIPNGRRATVSSILNIVLQQWGYSAGFQIVNPTYHFIETNSVALYEEVKASGRTWQRGLELLYPTIPAIPLVNNVVKAYDDVLDNPRDRYVFPPIPKTPAEQGTDTVVDWQTFNQRLREQAADPTKNLVNDGTDTGTDTGTCTGTATCECTLCKEKAGAVDIVAEGINWGKLSSSWGQLAHVFPFCLPFDLIGIFTAFTAPPAELEPVTLNILPFLPGDTGNVTLDFNIPGMDMLVKLFRTGMLILFSIGLIMSTRTVITW